MSMPLDLVLVRHGRTEGNEARARINKGDSKFYTPEFIARPSSYWRLNNTGQEQAKLAGIWIKQHITQYFDRYYTSSYIRARETAAILELPDAIWYLEYNLRSRYWGDFDLDVVRAEDRERLFKTSLQRQAVDSFFWTPPNGESIAQVCLRVNRVIDTMSRECGDKRVIVVCHADVMWCFRIILERLSPEQYHEQVTSTNSSDIIYNGQVLHYTRRHPDTGRPQPYISWYRTARPTESAMSAIQPSWQSIVRPQYTNEQLMKSVNKYKRLILD